MKPIFLVPLLAALAVAAIAPARADSSPSPAPVAASTPSRAEVLADLIVWQRSGLAALQGGEAGPDTTSATYRAALAAYQAERESPAFAQLVQRIASERGESTQVATRP